MNMPMTMTAAVGVALGWSLFLVIRFLTKDFEILFFLFAREYNTILYSYFCNGQRLEKEYSDMTFMKYLYSIFPYEEIFGITNGHDNDDQNHEVGHMHIH
jgi:hypothetical protein